MNKFKFFLFTIAVLVATWSFYPKSEQQKKEEQQQKVADIQYFQSVVQLPAGTLFSFVGARNICIKGHNGKDGDAGCTYLGSSNEWSLKELVEDYHYRFVVVGQPSNPVSDAEAIFYRQYSIDLSPQEK